MLRLSIQIISQKNAEIYCIDIDKAELKKHPKRFKTIKFDCKYFLSDLLIKLKNNKYNNKNTKWIDFCKNLKTKYGKSESRKKSMSIYNTVNFLSKIIPSDSTIVTGSSGLCIEVFLHILKIKRIKNISHNRFRFNGLWISSFSWCQYTN